MSQTESLGMLVFGNSPTALRLGTYTKKARIWSGRGMLVVGVVPAASRIGTSHTKWNWKQGSGTGSENNNKNPSFLSTFVSTTLEGETVGPMEGQ